MTTKSASAKALDAVVVVPGIMGSELVDGDGRQIWGLRPQDLAAAYAGDLLDRLRVTDGDLDGTRGVTATRLLRYPGVLAWFRGSEDYTSLVKRAANSAAEPAAVTTFPYDWRLSVEWNGDRLAAAAKAHWDAWRARVGKAGLGDPATVQLTVVAHSMGGLVTRAAQQSGKLAGVPLRVVTLGTPFYGSVKALRLVAEGQGAPLPGLSQTKLAALARSSPGVHDLLPRYRCISNGGDVRALTDGDIEGLGGDANQARAAAERWASLDWSAGPGAAEWHSAVGVNQPTLQSATIHDAIDEFHDAVVESHETLLGDDHGGDGTVYRGAAGPGWTGYSSSPLNDTHAALIASGESLVFVRDKLLHRDDAPPLGTSYVSGSFPDVASAGKEIRMRAARFTNADGEPHVDRSDTLAVSSVDLATGVPKPWQSAGVGADGWLTTVHPGLAPGLHRVSVAGGGASPVTELLWVGAD